MQLAEAIEEAAFDVGAMFVVVMVEQDCEDD